MDQGIPVEYLGKLKSFGDFNNFTTSGQEEDWSAVKFIKDSYVDFNAWKDAEDLDVIIRFVAYTSDGQLIHPIESRFELNINSTIATPTPFYGSPEEPTPTPTPVVIKDVDSWFKFDSITLETIGGELDLSLIHI